MRHAGSGSSLAVWLFALVVALHPTPALSQDLGILSTLLREFDTIGATYSPFGDFVGSEVFRSREDLLLQNWGVFIGTKAVREGAPRLRVGLETITGLGVEPDDPSIRGGVRILPAIAGGVPIGNDGPVLGLEVGAASLWNLRAVSSGSDDASTTLKGQGSGFAVGPFIAFEIPVSSPDYPWGLSLELGARYLHIPSIDWIRGKDEVVLPPPRWPIDVAEWMVHLSVRVSAPIAAPEVAEEDKEDEKEKRVEKESGR